MNYQSPGGLDEITTVLDRSQLVSSAHAESFDDSTLVYNVGPAEQRDEARGATGAEATTARVEVGPLSPLFRQRAIAAYMQDDHEGVLVGIAPRWGFGVFAALLAMHAAALVLSFVARIDVTARGEGVARSPGDLQVLTAKISGTVARVSARSGDLVSTGQSLVMLDSGALDTAMVDADKQIQLYRDQVDRFDKTQDKFVSQRLALLGGRASLMQMRVASQRETAARLHRKEAAFTDLVKHGYVAPVQGDEVREELAQAGRQGLTLQEQLSQTLADAAALRQERDQERAKLEQQLGEATNKRDALAFSLREKDIAAPRAGYLEALLVKPGDYVQAGAPIAKIVQSASPTGIVAFLPERDRAFLREGAPVRIDVEELPASEFGALTGTVSRIATDVASTYEVTDAFGDKGDLPGLSYRVEITIDERAKQTALYQRVRSGSRVSVRFRLRSVPIVALAFDSLRHWMDR